MIETQTKRFAPGTFCWAELMTSDGNSAKEFYGRLFGWSFKEDPLPDGSSYIMFDFDGKNVAAAYQMSAEMQKQVPPNWGQYVAVDSVDDAARKAVEAGGKVLMEPMDVMEVGRMAALQDPSGAAISAWQAKEHQGFELFDTVGGHCWTELLTDDPAKVKGFYSAVFGWSTKPMEGMNYEFFMNKQPAGEVLMEAGLMQITPEMGPVPPNWMPYFQVANCDDTAAKAQEFGGKVLMPGMDIPPGRFAVLQDPQGAVFSILQMKETQA